MSKKSSIGTFFLTAGAFAGGVITGLLLAPKSGRESREWIHNQADEVADWVDAQGKKAVHDAEERVKHLKEDVEGNLKKNFPDLYEATQEIGLRDEELVNERDDE